MERQDLLAVYDAIEPMLADIQSLFADHVKVTFIARDPINIEACLIIGDDADYNDVIDVLKAYKDREAQVEIGDRR